ncbi:MAG: hypothetical protein L0G25_06135 [Psychrobacter sp.]|nr:hypothetical protein [Psychrobacter sp.]
MSNKNEDKKSAKNDAVTGVEVVKDDTVVYEDGDFEEYNAEHDLEVDTDATLGGDDENKDDKSDKDDKSAEDSESKEDKSDKKNKDSKKSGKKANDKDGSDEEDKSGITMAGIYQWATKLREDFKSDAVDMKHDVSERATAMMLSKLLDAVDMELAAFDKSLDVAKNLLATAEERRKKIAAKKVKYQGMIDKLDQE